MCDESRMNGDEIRIDSNERVVKNTEVDQQWANWLAPTRRSFLFGGGAAAVGLTLGEQAARSEEPAASVPASAASAAFLVLNGPIKPYVSADKDLSEWGYETLKQPTVQPKGLWPGTENACLPSLVPLQTLRVITLTSISTMTHTRRPHSSAVGLVNGFQSNSATGISRRAVRTRRRRSTLASRMICCP